MSSTSAGTPETPAVPEGTPADAPRPPQRKAPRRAVRRGAEKETVWGVTADDDGGHDSNDERLRRDVPPHW
ncbi:hypothetical protein GCM10009718_27710 [Isoptericola halotolerans]|uniref:Uncharacterized protein n=1 Tax=Isoptericola halotolerans TaxID=300560 RepID=A0ABX2A3F0_9MICO|nr:hypothetical protein [Isoptericola halotolerans]NOV97379.1 hypothetical protein [Isoptericola halotolerans]